MDFLGISARFPDFAAGGSHAVYRSPFLIARFGYHNERAAAKLQCFCQSCPGRQWKLLLYPWRGPLSSLEQGPSGDGHFTQTDLDYVAGWISNTVRIATNQDFLLSDSSCFAESYLSGSLDTAVTAAHKAGLNVIFDLHWTDGGVAGTCATGQQKIANTRSLLFWQIMANRYKNDPRVFFELFNEPQDISWSCWLNGCTTCDLADCNTWVGMQRMPDSVRRAGFNNLVIMGGTSRAYDLSGVPNNLPSGFNIVYATHVHLSEPPSSWSANFGFLTSTYPLVATDFGGLHMHLAIRHIGARLFRCAQRQCEQPDGLDWMGVERSGDCSFRSIIADSEWDTRPDRPA